MANPTFNTMPYMASLNLPDLTRLMNDPIAHDPIWLAMSVKLPSDIHKFEGKPTEYHSNHVMTFHLWCSSITSLRITYAFAFSKIP